jgi:hypothetical protein
MPLLHKKNAIKRVKRERKKESREMVLYTLLSSSIIIGFGCKNN